MAVLVLLSSVMRALEIPLAHVVGVDDPPRLMVLAVRELVYDVKVLTAVVDTRI